MLQLAKHNPKEIFLAARTPAKAEAAIAEIKEAVPNASISFLQLDLASFKSIENAANAFNSRSERLDILLNNAGVMAMPYSKTSEGYEIQFGTNHMGHALLTKLLLPTLLRTAEKADADADVRIVNLTSSGHQMAPAGGIIWDQSAAETYGTWARYGSAKLANILHARALQKRYPQLTCTSVHPGVIETELFASTKSSQAVIRWGFWAFSGVGKRVGILSTIPQGARNSLWACTGPREEVRKGYLYTPVGNRSNGSRKAKDQALAEKLWDWTEEELKKNGY